MKSLILSGHCFSLSQFVNLTLGLIIRAEVLIFHFSVTVYFLVETLICSEMSEG